jgi:hypothetical protein
MIEPIDPRDNHRNRTNHIAPIEFALMCLVIVFWTYVFNIAVNGDFFAQ